DAALQAFREATRIADVPRRPGEPHWFEFLEFNRETFRKYLTHYISEVKRTNPQMQLCSNWAFSDHMPEPVCAPVDWISGDFTPQDSVNSARLSARYLVHQGRPWDLMAWSFITHGEHRNGSRQKSAVQIEREAALVLSQGGGFQFYHNQRRDGSVPEEFLPSIREVAEFCRARQPFCQGAAPVPQVAFLYSTASHYREINSLFGRDLSRLAGTLQALIEGQQVVDVVSESSLTGRISDYPLIVVGECDYLEPAFKQQLVDYVRDGGKLLLVGPQAASLFASELGVTLETAQGEPRYLAWDGAVSPTRDQTRLVHLTPAATAFGELHAAADASSPPQPAATIAALGSGQIAATWFSFSRGYLANRAPQMRSFLNALAHELFPEPLVEVVGNPGVDLCVNRLNGRLAIHLINTSGPHWDQEKPLIEGLAPIGPIGLMLRHPTPPTRLTLQPEGQPMEFDYRDGVVRVTVPQVRIHGILIVE
ncbi:MAG: hypothetical protein KDM81_16755, partial [Verrucomicrobiae bacterium]|nr:hypothetical protein [Verrucomicrobiae bacterium]